MIPKKVSVHPLMQFFPIINIRFFSLLMFSFPLSRVVLKTCYDIPLQSRTISAYTLKIYFKSKTLSNVLKIVYFDQRRSLVIFFLKIYFFYRKTFQVVGATRARL